MTQWQMLIGSLLEDKLDFIARIDLYDRMLKNEYLK